MAQAASVMIIRLMIYDCFLKIQFDVVAQQVRLDLFAILFVVRLHVVGLDTRLRKCDEQEGLVVVMYLDCLLVKRICVFAKAILSKQR